MPIAERIACLIEAEGPLPLSTFMGLALADPRHGYYATRDPFGPAGDFVTAPEISQIFGELVGLFFLDIWLNAGAPTPVHLIEAGPGRGTLMSDLLRAATIRPTFAAALQLHLVETSPLLRERQRAHLTSFAPRWHDSVEAALAEAREGTLFFVANEFFDALPIRQFQMTLEGWRERLVGLGPEGGFALGLGPALPDPPVADLHAAPIGAVIETAPAATAIATALGAALADRPGTALIIDYGYTKDSFGDTLQAVRGHRFAPLLEAPGDADLTAHVNFAALARAAEMGGAAVHGPVVQGSFLERLGLSMRASALAARGAQAAMVTAGARRLADPDAMGTLFKVLALTSPDAPTPPGFS